MVLAHRKRMALLALVPLVLLESCGGVKSCFQSAAVSAAGLSSSEWTLTCSASYSELTEHRTVRIDLDDIGAFISQATARIDLSVASGAASLSFYDQTGFPVTITAVKGTPAIYTGMIAVQADSQRYDIPALFRTYP